MPSLEKSCSTNNESPEVPALPVQHITNCISVVKSPNFPMSVLVAALHFQYCSMTKEFPNLPQTLWIRSSKCIHPEMAHHRHERYYQASKLLNWLILALDWNNWNTWQQYSCFSSSSLFPQRNCLHFLWAALLFTLMSELKTAKKAKVISLCILSLTNILLIITD